MSLRKKKPTKTLSDKISDLLQPQELLDPEIDPNDETTARERYYEDDNDDEVLQVDQRLSEIRKKNVKLLQDVDQKYSGKIASRRDFDFSDNDEDEPHEDSDDEEDGDLSDGSEGEEEDDASAQKSGALQDSSEDEMYEDSSDEDEEVEDAGDNSDADLDQSGEDEKLSVEDDDGSDRADSDDDKGSDDGDDDEEESDFDGDDIDLAPRKVSSSIDVDEPEVDSTNPSMKPGNLGADIQKGNSIQNQLHIWEKLLEVRIHSQKVLIKANSLPSFEIMETYNEDNSEFSAAVQKTNASVDKLLSKLTEMQSILTANYPETKDLNPRKRKHNPDDAADESKVTKYSNLLTERFDSYKDYRNSVLLKWYDRTKVLTPGTKEGKHAAQHNILQNISGILANRSDLVKKTQLHKGGYTIIGAPKIEASLPEDEVDPDRQVGQPEPEQFSSPEIYDDTDFYHTQLRELIEFKANSSGNASEMNRQFVELQKLRKKIKKVVDTRASKGRKIRYVVHNKMVNFMARNDTSAWTDDGKNELYSSLFGARLE